ncbi:Fungal Zn binuclear cluster domain containing protein [Coccidioides posadasii C735 delta SOWgp]|uniref:Fungal Zn binuclear cluster domain containing protein n=1 Tax=Coccidioides posadasii (strain C735) TaxID=222929 RepID=C5PEQ1_COCP7|nr:Fungal Zn binuclear cluster domain containing protein [Coccidioides posadasii C735 delta SOWgp]EER24571.1 Fungal Zn binuclear cluster domain containing protein [Coccidioides posadasii C735 delta SOWgp]|eukprot:XP_003066716.1 Fungal Zn binuclear cluster domain containing protein [Coccidioides posadasii C735 delta SOWgp]
MQSLRPVEPFPFTAFRQVYGSGSDPLRFSLHRSGPESCAYSSCPAPYPSPPMSGSPSPQDQLHSFQGEKRKRSNSPAPHGSQQVSEQPATYGGYPPKDRSTSGSISETRQSTVGQPNGSMISLSATAEQPHILPALGSAAPVPPRTTALPPRSTRRAKAHVASACVNCKRKHLGCDSARPCRRCVVAGKESSCVDVTHKRRGRPPLKAEEGPIRTYESAFGQSGTLRLSHQQPAHHQRMPSSRKIRPNTECRSAPAVEAGRDQKLRLSPPIPANTSSWGPSMLPSPSSTLPPSSPLSSVPLQRPLSSGNPSRSDRHGSIPSPSLPPPVPPQSLNDLAHRPPFSRDRLPPPRSPHQYKQGSAAPPFSSISGPTTHPVHSPIRLPPIPPPLPKLKVDFSIDSQQTGSNTSSPWSARTELPRVADRVIDPASNPISPLTQDESGLIERRWSHEHSLISSSYSLPPIRQPDSSSQRQRCFSASAMITSGHRDILNSPTVSEGASVDIQPVKRRKMELGEMVNN